MCNRNGGNGSQRLLLVEGPDDRAIVVHLGKVVSPYPTFYASPAGAVLSRFLTPLDRKFGHQDVELWALSLMQMTL